MFKLFANKKLKKKERMGRSNVFPRWETWSPKRHRVGLLGGKVILKTALCWAFGGKLLNRTTSFTNMHVKLHWSFLNTTFSLLSLRCQFFPNWNSPSKHSFLSLSSRFPFQSPPHSFQTSPTAKSTPLKHANFPNVTHFLAPVDTTTQGTKKEPSKDKCEFTFPFSSVIFNFLWVDTMIGLSLWNILTLVHVS